MDTLPQELLEEILGFLDEECLPSSMRVCRRWYPIGERLLYAETVIRFRSMLPIRYQDREVHHAMALDGSHSIAGAVRHLMIVLDTFPTDAVATMLASILQKTTGLISLDIQTPLHHARPILPQQDAANILQNVTALKATSGYITMLAPGRSLEAMAINDFVHWGMVSRIAEDLNRAALKHLRVAFDITTLDAAVEISQWIVQTFRSITHLVLQFRLPTTVHFTWEAFVVSQIFFRSVV